jgi:hypothetical protein
MFGLAALLDVVALIAQVRYSGSAIGHTRGGEVPLDPGFSEQKKILRRCLGLFHRRADDGEARRQSASD